ncbi:aldo/keto reductase [Nonomuraea sp. NPDC050451]|uniref:aldo/keto reductase n=1 Tax=Nonomuraea sp. NPDC050451 TaxID=3364364 RepID=UPI0037AB2992
MTSTAMGTRDWTGRRTAKRQRLEAVRPYALGRVPASVEAAGPSDDRTEAGDPPMTRGRDGTPALADGGVNDAVPSVITADVTLGDDPARVGASTHRVAPAWLPRRSATSVVIPGTSRVAHLEENIKAAEPALPADAIAELDAIGA